MLNWSRFRLVSDIVENVRGYQTVVREPPVLLGPLHVVPLRSISFRLFYFHGTYFYFCFRFQFKLVFFFSSLDTVYTGFTLNLV